MSERVNRAARADWHNPAVADEAAARFQLPLRPAWIADWNTMQHKIAAAALVEYAQTATE